MKHSALWLLLLALAGVSRADVVLQDTDSIEIVTSAAGSLVYDITWSRVTDTALEAVGSDTGAITTATTTTVVSAPASGKKLRIRSIVIRNDHGSTSQTITVQKDRSAANREWIKLTLAAGKSAVMDSDSRWSVYDTAGLLETAAAGAGGGGDNVSIDGAAATDPDFTSDGDLDAILCSGAGAPDASCAGAGDVIYRVQANSVALTTDTTGNYVASVGTTAPLQGGAAGSEGAAISLTVDSATAGAVGVIQLAGDLSGSAASPEVVQADALEADPANCSAGQAAGGIVAAGTAEACLDPIEETEMDSLAELDTQIGTTGTADSTTFLRGDNSWATPAGGGDSARTEDGDNAGTFTAMSDLDFEDSGDINFVRSAGPPDQVSGQIRASSVSTAEIATDGVSADELNATGVESELETELDIAGDVDGTGLSAVDIDEAAVENELEGALDLLDLQDGGSNTCTGSQQLRRNAGDTAFECFTPGGGGSAGGATTEAQFNSGGSLEGADLLTFASSTAGATFGAGSATAGTWPKLTSGTLLTTAEDGAIEADANAFYLTTDAGNRGVLPVRHCIRQDASRTLPNDTNENALFDSVTNGRITLETGTYRFEGLWQVTGMSATSGNALIDILGAGTATAGTWLWKICGLDNNTLTTVADDDCAHRTTQDSAASAHVAGTGTGMRTDVEGTVEITAAGTLIPSIDQVTAAAATLAAGSYFCIERIGSTTMTNVGQWD